MSERKYSAGPWRAEQTATGLWWVMAPEDENDHDFRDDYEPILESSGTGFNFEHDAKLAAAAPELLEACRQALWFMDVDAEELPRAIKAWEAGAPTAERGEWQNRARGRLRRAIEKAGGRDDS